jgi:hypothetical protein
MIHKPDDTKNPPHGGEKQKEYFEKMPKNRLEHFHKMPKKKFVPLC